MKHIKNIRIANADDLILFIRDGETIPSAASGWLTGELYLDKCTMEDAMNRSFSENVFLYEHERFQSFIMRPAPEMSYKEYKCRGKGAYLIMKSWDSFRRFLEQGK